MSHPPPEWKSGHAPDFDNKAEPIVDREGLDGCKECIFSVIADQVAEIAGQIATIPCIFPCRQGISSRSGLHSDSAHRQNK